VNGVSGNGAGQHIVIVGGGTAGWMTANLLAQRWPHMAIELVDAPEIGIIGVGEGSTPTLKRFFEEMGIAEDAWMPRCNATYKTNIRFVGWSPATGAMDYSHPFLTQIDLHTSDAFELNCRNRRLGLDVPTAPEFFFLNGVLAAQGKAPLAPEHFPFAIEYGYHFDSGLLGEFLRDHATARGVVHRQAKVVDAQLAGDGSVAHVLTDKGEAIAGDLFIDCSGFSALLMRGKLGVGFKSFRDNLFNNAAVVLPTPAQDDPAPETVSTALSHGWCWSIPLTSRVGNGYVFSSDYLAPDAAETELRAHLGQLDSPQEARHLRFNTGQLAQHWARNVLAVGLSQGFIEPLEATALHLVLGTVDMFMEDYQRGGFTNLYADAFNQKISERIERVRDYIVAHYKLNMREDSAYWQDNRENEHLSEPLRHILDVWFKRGDLVAELERQNTLSHFGHESWHCLLAGYGAFPAVKQAGSLDVDFYAARGIGSFLDRCSLNFPPQSRVLAGWAGGGAV
jgi:2-polyprenyl-6-methoxyphenol hydroxylase-like FAD-dependent oxidoreductase